MVPTVKEQFDNLPAVQQERIIEAAVKEFARHGYAAAQLSNIADYAGLSQTELTQYFATKDDLFTHVLNKCAVELERQIAAIIGTDDPLEKKISEILHIIQSTSKLQKEYVQVYLGVTTNTQHEMVQQISEQLENYAATSYSAILAMLQAGGYIRQDIDPGIMGFMLDNIFMMLQFSYACDYYTTRFQAYCGDDILQKDEEVVQQITKLILSMLEVQA